ncbi:MAG: LLM class flavin-dependent oxidoreductase [Acidimicrobiales bacterium]
MAVPFRIGVMQLTMEPVADILDHARQLDRNGFDTIWLAEAYPWWRKHSMEARSSTALSPLIAQATSRLAVGWGIISPYTRHPIQVAMDARVMLEMTADGSGRDRFLLGYGASKIFMRHIGAGERGPARPLTAISDSLRIVRAVLGGGPVEYDGEEFSAHLPPLSPDANAPPASVPLYVAGTGPRLQEMAGQMADGLLTPSITTPGFVRYARENLRRGARQAGRDADDIDLGCTIVASIDDDPDRGRQGAREIAAMYLANKVQNIRGSADVLLQEAGLSMDEIVPVADAMERGGRLAAADAVTDRILDKCRPIAGSPRECVERIQEYRDAGCTHVMLELWGDRRSEQIELFGAKVLPELAAMSETR